MKLYLNKRELVAMFMESPFYFDLRVQERLELLRDHERRWSHPPPPSGLTGLIYSGQVNPSVPIAHPVKVIVGYFPPHGSAGV
jgi:hypothetical protein